MDVDPKISWWIGLVTTVALAFSNASVWIDMIPTDYVPMVKAWNGTIGMIGTAVLTYLHGVSSPQNGPIAR